MNINSLEKKYFSKAHIWPIQKLYFVLDNLQYMSLPASFYQNEKLERKLPRGIRAMVL